MFIKLRYSNSQFSVFIENLSCMPLKSLSYTHSIDKNTTFLKKEEMKIQFNHEIAPLHLDYTHSHCWGICMIIIAISFHTQQIEWHNNNFTHSTATKSEIFIWQCYENLNKILFSYHRSRMCISAFKPHIQKNIRNEKLSNNSIARSCCRYVAILWKSKKWKFWSVGGIFSYFVVCCLLPKLQEVHFKVI